MPMDNIAIKHKINNKQQMISVHPRFLIGPLKFSSYFGGNSNQ